MGSEKAHKFSAFLFLIAFSALPNQLQVKQKYFVRLSVENRIEKELVAACELSFVSKKVFYKCLLRESKSDEGFPKFFMKKA